MLRKSTPPTADELAKRPGIKNADVPSETLGQPGVGDGASAEHFARDTIQRGEMEGETESDSQVPAEPRTKPDDKLKPNAQFRRD